MSLTHEQVVSKFLNGQNSRVRNLYSENGVLYSYGSHYALAKFDTSIGKYLINECSYSKSTGKQRGLLLNQLSSHRYMFVADPSSRRRSIDTLIEQIKEKSDEIAESKRKAPKKLSDLQVMYEKLALLSGGTGEYQAIINKCYQLGSYEELKKYVIGLRVAYILRKSAVAA